MLRRRNPYGRQHADGTSLTMSKLSIIIPMLNEATTLPDLMEHLLPFSRKGHEIIFVDGGSDDNSANLAELVGFRVIRTPPGRARQMNAGALSTSGEILLFLHCDTRLPVGADELVQQSLSTNQHDWGRFDVAIESRTYTLRIVSFMMNLRSRLTGIATGDQTIFVRRSVFMEIGGFPDLPLMEDIAISRKLKYGQRPVCLSKRVLTSARRWEARGIWRTILLMWRLRLAYWLGFSPERIARVYR